MVVVTSVCSVRIAAVDQSTDAWIVSSGDGLSGSLPGGIIYGAAAGTTDAGFGSLSTQFSSVFLLANGTANFHNLNMFGFQAIHEMTVLGKEFTKGFFNMTKDDKLYAYYQGRQKYTFVCKK